MKKILLWISLIFIFIGVNIIFAKIIIDNSDLISEITNTPHDSSTVKVIETVENVFEEKADTIVYVGNYEYNGSNVYFEYTTDLSSAYVTANDKSIIVYMDKPTLLNSSVKLKKDNRMKTEGKELPDNIYLDIDNYVWCSEDNPLLELSTQRTIEKIINSNVKSNYRKIVIIY